LEPNTNHGLDGVGPSCGDIHQMLRTCSELQCKGAALIGSMQHSPTGLMSSHEHPKAQGSHLSSLVLVW
jgi:hypothetical protein